MTATGFDLLRLVDDGGEGTAVIAVDLRGGRPGADVTELAGKLSGPLFEIVPPLMVGVDLAPSASAYAYAYADAIDAAGLSRVHLLGYCAGAVLALELARELRSRERHAALMMVDPLSIGVHHLLYAYEQIVRARPPEVVAEVTRLADAGSGAPLYDYLAGQIGSHHARQCELLGIDPDDEVATDLADRYLSWMAFVVAASTASLAPYTGDTAVLLSSDYGDQAVVQDSWQVTRMTAGQVDMLRDPAVQASIIRAVTR